MTEQLRTQEYEVHQGSTIRTTTVSSGAAERVHWATYSLGELQGSEETALSKNLRRTDGIEGKYSHKPGSSSQFASRKQEEIELEERTQ